MADFFWEGQMVRYCRMCGRKHPVSMTCHNARMALEAMQERPLPVKEPPPPQPPTVEERLESLEQEVAELRRLLKEKLP